MHPRFTLAALAVASLFASPAQAAAASDEGLIVITATRQPSRASELLSDVSVIDREQIEQSGQTSIVELLGTIPGIQFSASGGPGTSSSIYLRGTRSDQTKILVDGIPFNSIDLSGSPIRFMSLDDIERIEILRGPASALYGADAIGGVIQIFTKKGGKGLQGTAFIGVGSYNTTKTNGGLSLGNETVQLRINADENRSDGFSAKKATANRDRDNDGYETSNRSVALTVNPVAGHEFGAIARHGEGTVHYDSFSASGNYDDRNEFKSDVLSVYAKNRWLPFWTSTLQFGESTDKQINWSSFGGSHLNTRNRSAMFQNDLSFGFGNILLAAEQNDIDVGPSSNFLQKPELSTSAVLAGYKGSLGKLRIQASARQDDNDTFGKKDTGALSLGYDLSETLRIHASGANAFKAPSAYQLFNSFAGNTALAPETGVNREVGITWESATQRLSTVAYRNKVKQLIDYDFTTNKYQNVGKAEFEGGTIAYDGRYGDTTVRASIDLLRAYNVDTGKQLGRRAEESALLAVDRRIGKLEIGAEIKAVGDRYNSNTETQRLRSYTLLGVTAKYLLTSEWTLEFRGDNLGDADYELVQGYNTAGPTAFLGIRYQTH